jgi:hypothetical protein
MTTADATMYTSVQTLYQKPIKGWNIRDQPTINTTSIVRAWHPLRYVCATGLNMRGTLLVNAAVSFLSASRLHRSWKVLYEDLEHIWFEHVDSRG